MGHRQASAGRGMVVFGGGFDDLFRANLWLRAAARLLLVLGEGPAGGRDELYELASSFAWEAILKRGQTLAVEVAGRTAAFASTAFAALTVKDAVVDRLRARWGFRPDVARESPDVLVHLHLGGGSASVALDASGEPLSHRGYRPRGGPAPLSEALAGGLLALAGYDGAAPFLDPFCGTGTIAIEAALVATRTAPGLARRFACERWTFADGAVAARLREEAREARRVAAAPILASDIDRHAVEATRRNARAAGVEQAVRVARGDARDIRPPGAGSLIVGNPPYGRRLGDAEGLRRLYADLGDALKARAAGCTVWLLVGDRELAKAIGLRPSRRIVLFNGPIECRLLRFDIYPGSAQPAAAGAPSRPTP